MIKAYATSGAGSAGGGIGGLLLPLVLMFALSYFLMIKPQKKKQQEAIQLKNSLKAGDTVILYSGLVGTIVAVDGEIITIECDPDKVRLNFQSYAVARVTSKEETLYEETEEDKEFERQLFGEEDNKDDKEQ
ncbi:preprotein translocase subunit YajC [Criibacterium bergeronii]|uniref:Preprotein translocase subunit YajC n=1 Tax=Criibacterium bergeronii TaxID=1871336 RepID=A0A371IMW6_9FIRM|nr:preprotein translocase subunit YajC [Criibacterium bergeronii]MBS6063061.1 preprotein translocase subunit YajC [Peptostreptococcaceae bacterium]RDY21828.1 preprotein translocase subunit YajC [Criibacterium bergeronii]